MRFKPLLDTKVYEYTYTFTLRSGKKQVEVLRGTETNIEKRLYAMMAEKGLTMDKYVAYTTERKRVSI